MEKELFVGRLADTVDDNKLMTAFQKVGEVNKATIVRNSDGSSRGYGFVEMATSKGVQAGIDKLNGFFIDGTAIYVEKKRISTPDVKKTEYIINQNRLYVGNLEDTDSLEDLKTAFEQYGLVLSIQIIKDKVTNRSRGFGFVEMVSDKDAQEAINKGVFLDKRKLFVQLAKNSPLYVTTTKKYNELYVSNLPYTVDDMKLRTVFEKVGPVVSANVKRDDENGSSLEFGYVVMKNSTDVQNAINMFNGSSPTDLL